MEGKIDGHLLTRLVFVVLNWKYAPIPHFPRLKKLGLKGVDGAKEGRQALQTANSCFCLAQFVKRCCWGLFGCNSEDTCSPINSTHCGFLMLSVTFFSSSEQLERSPLCVPGPATLQIKEWLFCTVPQHECSSLPSPRLVSFRICNLFSVPDWACVRTLLAVCTKLFGKRPMNTREGEETTCVTSQAIFVGSLQFSVTLHQSGTHPWIPCYYYACFIYFGGTSDRHLAGFPTSTSTGYSHVCFGSNVRAVYLHSSPLPCLVMVHACPGMVSSPPCGDHD